MPSTSTSNPGARRQPAAGIKAGPSGLVRLTAPMTGSNRRRARGSGDEVEVGDVLLIVESMKMNNELRATASGRVEAVPVGAGQRVTAGTSWSPCLARGS